MKPISHFDKEEFLRCGALISFSNGRLWVGWGTPSKRADKEKNFTRPSFYLNDFFLEEAAPWREYPYSMELDISEFQSLLQDPGKQSVYTWSIQQSERFREAFESLKQLFREGTLDKGVPYLFSHSSQEMDRILLEHCIYQGLMSLKKKSGYLYGCWSPGQGILGLTPETLFLRTKEEPQKLRTMALAGTSSSTRDVGSFLNDQKERYEHQVVVNGVSEALRSFGRLHIGAVRVLMMPNLNHLMTPIELDLGSDFDFSEIVRVLHPTPALGAFPRENGAKWLRYMDRLIPRNYYGAPIGFQCPQSGCSLCLVAIRNVQWHSSDLRVGGGCGVVMDSVFDREWDEVQLKIQSIKEQFDL